MAAANRSCRPAGSLTPLAAAAAAGPAGRRCCGPRVVHRSGRTQGRPPIGVPLVVTGRAGAAPAVAAAATAAAAAPQAWFTATGVPLLEVLQQLTLEQAAVRSLALVLATAVGVLLSNKLLDIMVAKMDAVQERTKQSSGLQLLAGTALAAVHTPAKVTLPYLGLTYSLLVISAFADVALSRMEAPQVLGLFHVCSYQVLAWLKGATQLMQDSSELCIIVFAAWFAIAWKDRLLTAVTGRLQDDMNEDASLTRVLVPLSNLLTWGIVAAATLCFMQCWGINIQPLLAVGSIGTVAVGFAAQSTMQNVVSALQIYSTRPFIVGDRVQLKSMSGSTIVAGVVEHIAPMRTVLRGDNKLPIYIGNKDVMNLIVVNESDLRRDKVLPKQPLVEDTFTLRYADMDQVPAISEAITEYLRAHPSVDGAINARCVLVAFTSAGPQLAFKALLHKSVASRQAFIKAELLTVAERIVRSHGAYLSIQYEFPQDLPPSPPPKLGLAGVSGEFGVAPAGP